MQLKSSGLSMPQFNLSLESDLLHRYPTAINKFWNEHVTFGYFKGVDNKKITYSIAKNANTQKTVVISSGRIEGLIKYKEVVFDLYNNGYSVFIHDHRGQGFSERLLTNPHKGYVEQFDHYVEDFRQFMHEHVLPHTQRPNHSKPSLLCHSMGGAIGALYLLRYPDDFNNVAFSAPMFGIAAPLPISVVNLLINVGCTINRLLKSEPWYFIGLGDYACVPFEKNVLTNSDARYRLFREEYEQHTEVKLGGTTFHWLKQAVSAMNTIEKSAHNIKNNCLILQAGNDSVVDNKKQKLVADNIPSASVKVIPNAKHELLLESDQFRLPAIQAILEHFKDTSANPPT